MTKEVTQLKHKCRIKSVFFESRRKYVKIQLFSIVSPWREQKLLGRWPLIPTWALQCFIKPINIENAALCLYCDKTWFRKNKKTHVVKLEPQHADISATQWSAYLVLFRWNVTLHHRMSQAISDTVCSDIMAISIQLVFIQIRADRQTSPALRRTPNASENLLHWKFHQTVWNARLVQIRLKKKSIAEITLLNRMCAYLQSVYKSST